MSRILIAAPLLTLLLAAPALAAPHREQIPVESWSWSTGTGKTMAAQVIASR